MTEAPSASSGTSIAPSGDPRVDDALALLEELDDMPVIEHPPVYEDVHERLRGALADLRRTP